MWFFWLTALGSRAKPWSADSKNYGSLAMGPGIGFKPTGALPNRQAEEVLGASPNEQEDGTPHLDCVPPRLVLLVREAWKKTFYSEGQLARLLRLHRLEVRQLLDGVETEQHEANELVELPR